MEGRIVLAEIKQEAEILYHDNRIYGYQPLYFFNISDYDRNFIRGIEFDGINVYFYNKYYLPYLKIGTRIPCKIIKVPAYLSHYNKEYLKCVIFSKDERDVYMQNFNRKSAKPLINAFTIGREINHLPLDIRKYIWNFI